MLSGDEDTRETPGWKSPVDYLVRLILLLVFFSFIGLPIFSRLIRLGDVGVQLRLVEQLDLFHAVFYGSLPAAFLILFLPSSGSKRLNPVFTLLLAVGLGIFCAWMPVMAGLSARPHSRWNRDLLFSSVYIGLNVALMIWWHLGGYWKPRLKHLLKKSYVVADLLLPAPLWAASTNSSRLFFPLRLVPVVLVAWVAVLPWMRAPLLTEGRKNLDPALTLVDRGPYYQVTAEPTDGDVYLTSDPGSILTKIESASSKDFKITRLDTGIGLVQAFALDADTHRLIGLNPEWGSALVVDAVSLDVLQKKTMNMSRNLKVCRTLWHGPAGILMSFCGTGTALFCPDAQTMIAYHSSGEPGDALIDPDGSVIHEALVTGSTYGQGLLVALDGKTLEPKRVKVVPRAPERLALDPVTGRLFLSFPASGRVLVLDKNTYGNEKWIRTFVGVRTLAVDVEGRRLVLGGFSPILEVRSLDDFSLIDRMIAPAHARGMAVDGKRGVAYLTSQSSEASEMGLWSLNLNRRGGDSIRKRLNKLDPFYAIMDETVLILHHLLVWDNFDKSMHMIKPAIYRRDDCPAGDWRSENQP